MFSFGPRSGSKGRRIPGLDELRGLAVLAVLACHLIAVRIPSWHGRLVVTAEGITNQMPSASAGPASLRGWIDSPFERGYPPYVGMLGWAGVPGHSPGSGVKSVLVSMDAGPYLPAEIGMPRAEVRSVYPTLSDRCGWRWWWPMKGVAAGRHVMHVRVEAEDGNTTELERSFMVADLSTWPVGARWSDGMGQAGVDMFFLISGFLITGILLRTRGSPGYFGTFYARRAWRILPLAIALVLIYGMFRPETRPYGWHCLLFCANLPSTTLLPCGYIAAFWTLSVEEQFYLLMPALLALIPKRYLGTAIGALCLALAAPRMMNVELHDGLFPDTSATLYRSLPIAIGAWLALVREGRVHRPGLWLAGFVAWIGILFSAGGRLGLLDVVGLFLFPALVWLAASGRFALRNSPLRVLGIHCYGIYLLHMPLLEFLNSFASRLDNLWFTVSWLGMVLTAAFLSFRYFERPLMALAPAQPTALPVAPATKESEEELDLEKTF